MLDTHVLCALMTRVEDVVEGLRERSPDDLLLTPPVAAEIRFGLERLPVDSRRRQALQHEYDRWRGVLAWQDWTEGASHHFGMHKARLEREGRIVEDFDIAVGAIALSIDAPVATLKTRHLSRLEGLRLLAW